MILLEGSMLLFAAFLTFAVGVKVRTFGRKDRAPPRDLLSHNDVAHHHVLGRMPRLAGFIDLGGEQRRSIDRSIGA
jgi:hypothetical protein